MDNYVLSSSFYCVVYNGQCIKANLPEGVDFENHTICFQNQKPVEIQFVYLLDQNESMDINIVIKEHVEIQMIETKIFENHSHFQKKIYVQESAMLHIFSENDSSNEEDIYVKEEVFLQNDALCQCGYAELSDGCYDGKYHYYLQGEGAQAKVRMAVLSKKKESKHYEVFIQHCCPLTYGQMDNYGVVKDEGKLIIDGVGSITKGQHGSASHQTNKIMVFDEKCVAQANPYLYIDEYDVKASHAAAVGKMDEEHLYYLQSRGLTKKQAMHLITYGYLKPVIAVIDNKMIKERFETALSKVGA